MPMTVESTIRFARQGRGAGRGLAVDAAFARSLVEPGRVPRVARLLALAHRFNELLRQDIVKDYADLASLGHVSRARISQIMNLLLLAPDIQEALLFLPRSQRGRDAVRLAQLQPLALTPDWRQQRRFWRTLQKQRPIQKLPKTEESARNCLDVRGQAEVTPVLRRGAKGAVAT